ncbi:MAG: zinc ribbon domain-containing protein [Smithella sp.]
MFCRKCGKEIPDDSLFCDSCGSKVEIKEIQPSTKSIQTPPPNGYFIDDTLTLYKDGLWYNGEIYYFSAIKSLTFGRLVYSVNGISIDNATHLLMTFDNDKKIEYNSERSLTRGKLSKTLEQVYYYLQKNTFDIRSNKIINTLNKDGFIKFGTPEVRLYSDGTIEDENGRHLKISKSLRIGFGAQGVNFTDPNEIRISDKPRPFLQFDCFESKNTIKFHLYENMDVYRAIFKYFLER